MARETDKDFLDALRDHGIKATYERLAIYQAVYSSKGHPTVDVIYQLVKKRFPMISLGTVYKTLEKLYEVRLIQKVSPITDVVRYEPAAGRHHHLVCLECQKILDVDAAAVEEPKITVIEQSGFHVVRQQVILHGYCSACRGNVADSEH